MLCGTGAHGAYHAGVLRALQEAGVKIDVMAGHGVGAGAAALASIDGAARLWEADGIWKSPGVRAWYRWKWPLRAATWLGVLLIAVLVTPIVLFAVGIRFYPLPFIVTALVVVLAPVNQSFQRYAAEFVSRVTLATYPAMVIWAALGAVWAWRAGVATRILSAVLVAAACVVGIDACMAWLR